MPILINQYSFIIISIVSLILIGIFIWRAFNPALAISVMLVAILILSVIFISLRRGEATVSSLEDFNLALESGPLLIDFYSDYWVGCLLAKPDVDRLEKQLKGKVQVIRLNVANEFGKQLKFKFNVGIVPGFVLVNKEGKEILKRTGKVPSLEKIVELVDSK